MTTALLAASLVVAAGCGDDDDDVTGVLGSNDDVTEPSTSGGVGYTDAQRDAFMTSCTVQGTEAECACTWDHIVQNVPIEEFVAYDDAVRANPSAQPPQGVLDAIDTCIG